jgi:hypothetical protein
MFKLALLILMFSLLSTQSIVSAQTANSTVGLTITAPPTDPAVQEQRRQQQAKHHAAWLALDLHSDTPVEVVETINGQTTHYWEYPDGTISDTPPTTFHPMPANHKIGPTHESYQQLISRLTPVTEDVLTFNQFLNS